MKKEKSNRVGHINWRKIKNSKYPIFRVLFLLGVSLEVISKSVLKGVFLVEKGECRRKLKSLDCDRLHIVNYNSIFNLHL